MIEITYKKSNDYEFYYSGGKLHREDGPAFIHSNGTQLWYFNGKLHCEDGPAVIHSDGTQVWYINDKNVTSDANKWLKDHNIDNWQNMTDEDKIALSFFMRSL